MNLARAEDDAAQPARAKGRKALRSEHRVLAASCTSPPPPLPTPVSFRRGLCLRGEGESELPQRNIPEPDHKVKEQLKAPQPPGTALQAPRLLTGSAGEAAAGQGPAGGQQRTSLERAHVCVPGGGDASTVPDVQQAPSKSFSTELPIADGGNKGSQKYDYNLAAPVLGPRQDARPRTPPNRHCYGKPSLPATSSHLLSPQPYPSPSHPACSSQGELL